ncbi:hypothetical protein AVEN_218244-1 [Araneus ventricosus]|uniref:Uncharacterized protein n=1 Tax=Araneus ventricosus TaxID=182803 RepID=A0A4Y2M9F1_ARAVE|nr:hypothetical protein AVEN_218244-1 [Araneus ventricosus]
MPLFALFVQVLGQVVKKIVDKRFLLNKRNRCPKEVRISKNRTGVSKECTHFRSGKDSQRHRVLFVTFRKDKMRTETEKCGFDNWVRSACMKKEKSRCESVFALILWFANYQTMPLIYLHMDWTFFN